MMTLKDLWCVKADYYFIDPNNKDEILEVPNFVSITGENKLISFTEKPDRNLRIFASKKEAEKWCKEHNNGMHCSNGDYYPVSCAEVFGEEK